MSYMNSSDFHSEKLDTLSDMERMDNGIGFQPLPKPTGPYPYHLNLAAVIDRKNYENIVKHQKMVFHTVGDTGDEIDSRHQKLVAQNMASQFIKDSPENAAFFYILGDVVYNNGALHKYKKQFYEPYQNYPAPIFAIPGNHDGEIESTAQTKPKSLYAFHKLFCATEQTIPPEAGNSRRKTMIQPNVYWTLQTPVANIIGLYTNVPEFGVVSREQTDWFIEELKTANAEKSDKALIITLHHPPYSLDNGHGPSVAMQLFLEDAFKKSAVIPDLILSGHVHNYQRFTRRFGGDREVPYIVAGAGGYLSLHHIAYLNSTLSTPTSNIPFKDTTLESYYEDGYGFLRLTIDAAQMIIKGEYFTVSNNDKVQNAPLLFDTFTLDFRTHKLKKT